MSEWLRRNSEKSYDMKRKIHFSEDYSRCVKSFFPQKTYWGKWTKNTATFVLWVRGKDKSKENLDLEHWRRWAWKYCKNKLLNIKQLVDILTVMIQNHEWKNPNKFGLKSHQLVIKYLYVRYSLILPTRIFLSL